MGDHTETVDLDYNPAQISYEELLALFWKCHDPTTNTTNQYMSAIFYHDSEQKALAEKSMEEQQKHMARKIATKILPATEFFEAENYHQKYLLRQQFKLFDTLGLEGQSLIRSYAAARLNGFVGKYGTVEQFEKESKEMGLSQSQITQVKRVLAASP
ncbi:peptide methionine sulfoxide reductase-like [Lingula anatina]|uniref:peptide-methionine (S)-S-oxide reductase n=1 Tax=Lingula anatina TaxID=7574 RepID=A0A1S3J752_LINAN|nr:peptide methionine sulfoxide reductase-like [Lingula anatina]|eukprot:XP_013405669.1 peptide methionine sulfoxide reductase-like [Lingula anatina]